MSPLKLNPEEMLARSRVSPELNQKAVKAELKVQYCRKAWLVGMTLEAYCARFGIRGVV